MTVSEMNIQQYHNVAAEATKRLAREWRKCAFPDRPPKVSPALVRIIHEEIAREEIAAIVPTPEREAGEEAPS